MSWFPRGSKRFNTGKGQLAYVWVDLKAYFTFHLITEGGNLICVLQTSHKRHIWWGLDHLRLRSGPGPPRWRIKNQAWVTNKHPSTLSFKPWSRHNLTQIKFGMFVVKELLKVMNGATSWQTGQTCHICPCLSLQLLRYHTLWSPRCS